MQYIISTTYTFNTLRFTTVKTHRDVHVGNVIELRSGAFSVGWGLKVKLFATEAEAVVYLKARFESIDVRRAVEIAA